MGGVSSSISRAMRKESFIIADNSDRISIGKAESFEAVTREMLQYLSFGDEPAYLLKICDLALENPDEKYYFREVRYFLSGFFEKLHSLTIHRGSFGKYTYTHTKSFTLLIVFVLICNLGESAFEANFGSSSEYFRYLDHEVCRSYLKWACKRKWFVNIELKRINYDYFENICLDIRTNLVSFNYDNKTIKFNISEMHTSGVAKKGYAIRRILESEEKKNYNHLVLPFADNTTPADNSSLNEVKEFLV